MLLTIKKDGWGAGFEPGHIAGIKLNLQLTIKKDGWGARIRTWVWRDQNPLPYRLATPQWMVAMTGFEPVTPAL